MNKAYDKHSSELYMMSPDPNTYGLQSLWVISARDTESWPIAMDYYYN